MGISDLFGKAFGILKANPKIILPYLAYTAIIGVISIYVSLSIAGSASAAGVNMASGFFSQAATTLVKLIPLLIFVIIVAVFATPFLIAMYISIADQGYKSKTVYLAKAANVAKSNYLNMLLALILVGVILIIVVLALAALFGLPALVIGHGIGRVLWLLLGVIVSVVVLVALALCLYETYTVLILERLGPIAAIERSFQIGKQKMGPLFKVLLLSMVIAIAFVIVDVIVVFVIQFLLGISGYKLLGLGIAQTINFILGSAFNAWFMMVPVAFYKAYVGKAKASRRRRGAR